jgi:polyferredoxin
MLAILQNIWAIGFLAGIVMASWNWLVNSEDDFSGMVMGALFWPIVIPFIVFWVLYMKRYDRRRELESMLQRSPCVVCDPD